MNIKTESVAVAITVEMSEAEYATLEQAASRAGKSSVGDLLKATILSSCEGVKTPCSSERDAISA